MSVHKVNYGCGWEQPKAKTYIEHRVDMLAEFGISDTAALKSYLINKTKNATSEVKKEIQVDNICKTILDDYFNGDRTFCIGFN